MVGEHVVGVVQGFGGLGEPPGFPDGADVPRGRCFWLRCLGVVDLIYVSREAVVTGKGFRLRIQVGQGLRGNLAYPAVLKMMMTIEWYGRIDQVLSVLQVRSPPGIAVELLY